MPWPSKKTQFSLKTLLLVILATSLVLHWSFFGPNARKWRAVRGIEAAGGTVLVEKAGPEWLRSVAGDRFVDFFWSRPYSIFAPREFRDEDLTTLGALAELETLSLEGSQITDSGLNHLYTHKQLLLLNLESTAVTDAGAQELQKRLAETIITR